MKKIAVILSGCGVFDGSEISEAVLTLLHIAKSNAQYQCFAPNIEQMHVLNHQTGEEMTQARNVLTESARIARGEITDLKELQVEQFDAVILPGGFGVAKNLSDFAIKGQNAQVNPIVFKACKAFADAKKPAGYICIAPALIPLIYGQDTQATIGNDPDTASALNAMGAHHVECSVDNIVVDEKHKVVSTPAYMLANSIIEADSGIACLVQKVLSLCD